MTNNYFNTQIVARHDDQLHLNNSMAEAYDFCLGIAEKCDFSKADVTWYYEQKRSYICYDV